MSSMAVLQQIAGATPPPGAPAAASGAGNPPAAGRTSAPSSSLDMLQKVQANPNLAFQAPPLPMPTQRPASSNEFDQAQQAGGYTEPAEKSGRPITYLMQKPEESYEDFMKRAVAHGKGVTPQQIEDEANQPLKAALGVPLQVGKDAATWMGTLTALSEAGMAGGSQARKALEWTVNWAKNNKGTAGLGLMWLLNEGLSAAGLPNASRIVEKLELPAILLLGGRGGSVAGAEEETAAQEAIKTGEEALANKTAATTAATEPAAAAARPAESELAPVGSAERVDQLAQTEQGAGNGKAFEDVETLPKAQRQAASDKYYAEHPEKRPQPKIIGRGPNKGQQKTVRVFESGKGWVEVPQFK